MLLRDIPEFLAKLNEKDQMALFGDPSLHRSINEAIDSTKKREKRKRRLSACLTLYVVLGLSLFRRLSIPNALTSILSCLRDVLPGLPYRPASEGSMCEARYRLGSSPLKALFEARAALVIPPPAFYGLRIWAIDGVRFQMPDTAENEAEFGRQTSGRGSTAYPVARLVALVDTHGHQIRAIDIDRWSAAERDAVDKLIEPLGDEDLVLLDRGFPSGALFLQFEQKGVHFVSRITSSWRPRIIKQLGVGDFLVTVAVKAQRPPVKPGAKPRNRTDRLLVRMLVYTCGKSECRILTDLSEASDYPSLEIATLYHERWEAELVYDEVKTHFATTLNGTQDLCIRSKLPEGVLQEIYAMFTAYNLVRSIIATAATTHGLEPRQISFVDALTAILLVLPKLIATTGDEQEALMQRLYRDIARNCRLRARRNRQYGRKVKIKMSDYGCKTAQDCQTKDDLQAKMTNPSELKTWSRRRQDPVAPSPAPAQARHA
jgi:hypothetical protein